jgi:hypothetical protein
MSTSDFNFYQDQIHNDILAVDKTVEIDEDETLPCVFFNKKDSTFSNTIVEISFINAHCVLISHAKAREYGKKLTDFLDRSEPKTY